MKKKSSRRILRSTDLRLTYGHLFVPAVLLALVLGCSDPVTYENPFDPESPDSPLGQKVDGVSFSEEAGYEFVVSWEGVQGADRYEIHALHAGNDQPTYGEVIEETRWTIRTPLVGTYTFRLRYLTTVEYQGVTESAWSDWQTLIVYSFGGGADDVSTTIVCDDIVAVDGQTSDWPVENRVLEDPPDAGAEFSVLDIQTVWIACDAEYVYLRADSYGSDTQPSDEYRNNWFYFGEAGTGDPSFAVSIADFGGAPGSTLFETSGSQDIEVESELPAAFGSGIMETRWARDNFNMNARYGLSFYSHSTADLEWQDNGDSPNEEHRFRVDFADP